MSYMPVIIESSGRSNNAYDLLSRLLKDRIIMLTGEVHDEVAASIVAQLLYLEIEDADKEITFYINSPGGVITAGMAIYDTMNLVSPKINTVCIGQAASMGAFLLSAGDYRMALPNASIMIHQPLGGAGGQASDIAIQAKEILKMKHNLNTMLAKHTGQTYEQIEKDTDRDNFMSAQEALEYGLIDKIITKPNT